MNVITTFSGTGGSSLGYKMAGMKVRLAVEWDDHAVACYRLNFPNTDLYHGDIAKLSVAAVLERTGLKVGELDIFDGSPPCQGFSTAGARNFTDDRNQLFKEYVRLLNGLQPRAFVMENVAGMVKGKMKLTFVECLRALKVCGYQVSAKVLNAAWYGVPQSRPRLIFIGVRSDLGIKPSHPLPTVMHAVSVGQALKDCPSGPYRSLDPNWVITPFWYKMKPGETASKYHPKGHFFNMVKVNPMQPCTTLTKTLSGTSGQHHWSEPRSLSIPELKRIQSLPDDFQLVGTFTEQWARIGNSVPPFMMKAIAEHIGRILTKT